MRESPQGMEPRRGFNLFLIQPAQIQIVNQVLGPLTKFRNDPCLCKVLIILRREDVLAPIFSLNRGLTYSQEQLGLSHECAQLGGKNDRWFAGSGLQRHSLKLERHQEFTYLLRELRRFQKAAAASR